MSTKQNTLSTILRPRSNTELASSHYYQLIESKYVQLINSTANENNVDIGLNGYF